MSTTGDKIKGKLKETEGRVTGDKVREAQGRIQKTTGEVGSKIKAGVRRVKAAIDKKIATTKAGRKAAAAKHMP